jgi:hypothetical protein
MQFYKTYASSGTAYLWPYPGRHAPMRLDVLAADNYCAMLGGRLPSIHTLAHVEHLSGVYAALWPVHHLTVTPRIHVGMPTPDMPTHSLYLWSDYTPLTWPGAGVCDNGFRRSGWLDTAVTGQLGFSWVFDTPASFAACAGGRAVGRHGCRCDDHRHHQWCEPCVTRTGVPPACK